MTRPLPSRLVSALTVFSLVFPVVYTVAYYNEWALFWFYPLVGELYTNLQPPSRGPAMIYYGWIVLAFVSAALAGAIVPRRWAAHLWVGWSWIVPLAATLFTLAYETRWFQG